MDPNIVKPAKKTRIDNVLIIAAVLLLLSSYVGLLTIYPKLFFKVSQATNLKNIVDVDNDSQFVVPPGTKDVKGVDNSIFIPSISLNEKIHEGDEAALDLGIWHKFANRSDPTKGGNFVLTGHRFNFGLTPESTRRKSPLYNIDELKTGDKINVKWNNKNYSYKVTKIYSVKPTTTDIERNSSEHKLTIYTCTLKGKYDGRVVIIAKLIN